MQKGTATFYRFGRVLAIAGTALWFTGVAAAAEGIKIGGSGNALGTMRLLGDAFSKQNPAMKVTVLPSLGSSGAIKAVPKGAIDIGLSMRSLTLEESKLGAIAIEYARTPLVFAVSAKSQVNAITLAQIADIYNGKLVTWPDGSQIRPVLRPLADDNSRQVKRISPALDKALAVADKRPGMPFATSDQDAAKMVESMPGALGVLTLGQILSEDRALRALMLDGVEATANNGASGKYPHVKNFFLITRPEPTAVVKHFIAFVQSPAGRDILMRAGHWIP